MVQIEHRSLCEGRKRSSSVGVLLLMLPGLFIQPAQRAGLYGRNTSFGDPNFGRLGQAYPARSIQFGLKLYW